MHGSVGLTPIIKYCPLVVRRLKLVNIGSLKHAVIGWSKFDYFFLIPTASSFIRGGFRKWGGGGAMRPSEIFHSVASLCMTSTMRLASTFSTVYNHVYIIYENLPLLIVRIM